MLENVLIVSAREEPVRLLMRRLEVFAPQEMTYAKSEEEARTFCRLREFPLILLIAPTAGGFETALASDLLSSTSSAVAVLCGEGEEAVQQKLTPLGGLVLPLHSEEKEFRRVITLCIATYVRMCTMRRENIRLQKKIEDSKIIHRAKCILMEYLSMSEAQAHKYLERQAMDLRLPKVVVAKNLLSTYDG